MLVWLASYPRSGNTLTRTILNECFGIETVSIHGVGDDEVFNSEELRKMIGHVSSPLNNQDLLRRAQGLPEPFVIKSHEPLLTDDKTIHVVRNGISSIASYWHYLRDINAMEIDVEQVIRGEVFAGSWSAHCRMLLDRPDTILVRYETLVQDPNAAAKAIGQFLGVEQKSAFRTTFSDMHKLKPNFFRKGSDEANVREMAPYMDMIVRHHGDVLRELGYL